MHEVTAGRAQGFSPSTRVCTMPGEERHFIAHAAMTDMGHAQAGLHFLRISQGGKVVALRLDHQTHEGARMNVEPALFDQKPVHGRVKPAVINHIVDMPVDVVVQPAGADRIKNCVGAAGLGIVLVLIERSFPKAKAYIPSATGLGLAFTTPGYNSISMFIGASIALWLEKRHPAIAEKGVVAASSGLIAGESLMGVLIAVLVVAGLLNG